MEEYGKDRQAKDDNIIPRMRFACWITKANNTQSEYVTYLRFYRNNGYFESTSVLGLHIYCLSCILLTVSKSEASKLSYSVAPEKHVDGSIIPFLKKFSCTSSGKPRNPSVNAPAHKRRKQKLIITYTINYQKNNFRIFNNVLSTMRG